MADVTYPCEIILRDAKGLTSAVRWYLFEALLATAQTDCQTVAVAIGGVTQASQVTVRGPGPSPVGALSYGANAQWANVEDKMILLFIDGLGSYHRYAIPAPIAAGQFLADGITVDKTNAAVAALITAFLTVPVCGIDGSALTTFVGGWLRRRRTKRRLNHLTLDPTLTVPAL